MNQKYRFGVFDFDGTFIDNMPSSAEAFEKTLISNGFNIPKGEAGKFHLETAGTQLNDQMRGVLQIHKIPFDEDAISKLNEDFFVCRENLESWQDAKPFPKTKNVLALLYDEGIGIFLSSGSKADGIKKSVKQFELNKYITFIMGGCEIPKGPEHIKEFAKSVNLSVEEFSQQAFYCGDGARDMEIAKMFDIYAIGIAQTLSKQKLLKAGADVVVDKIGDVLELEVLR